jgi:hypothetical protein
MPQSGCETPTLAWCHHMDVMSLGHWNSAMLTGYAAQAKSNRDTSRAVRMPYRWRHTFERSQNAFCAIGTD